jgi:hypothetical protein
MRQLDHFYLQLNEPIKGCFLALSDIILLQDKEVTTTLKYGMPFFCYKGKMFCYFWINKKDQQPYIGFVEGKWINHPDLVSEKRARIKIMNIDAGKDLPITAIESVLQQALSLYKTGVIKVKSR